MTTWEEEYWRRLREVIEDWNVITVACADIMKVETK